MSSLSQIARAGLFADCGAPTLDRNTTLPHPDADLSPNATITAEDVPLNHVLHRSRRSFLTGRNKGALTYGKITGPGLRGAASAPEHASIAEAEAEPASDGDRRDGQRPSHDAHDAAGHTDGDDSVGRTSSSGDGDDDDAKRRAHAPTEVPKKRGVLRKLRLLKP